MKSIHSLSLEHNNSLRGNRVADEGRADGSKVEIPRIEIVPSNY